MKYTDEQKQEVFAFFEEGCTAREIFEVTNIPIGTINRWRSERRSSNKYVDEDLRSECEDLRRRVEELEKYINKLKRDEESTRSYEEPVKGWKPPKR